VASHEVEDDVAEQGAFHRGVVGAGDDGQLGAGMVRHNLRACASGSSSRSLVRTSVGTGMLASASSV
jgi:hypothetical protein